METVATRVTPTQSDRDKMDRLSHRLTAEVVSILTTGGLDADVSVQGSVARDTWLRREGDLDIFVRLPADMDRNQWTGKLLPVLRTGLRHYTIIERYAEHPFLELLTEKTRVNVVPCYKVEKGKWKSATDRTPFHTEYMREHLSPDLRMQARLLKKFLKGVGIYGAEIKVGGFSGMLVETLTLNYRSFSRALGEAGRWANHTLVQVEPTGRSEAESIRKFQSPLVVMDPVDPNRNLAAALRDEKLWKFVAAGRCFLDQPSLSYFYPHESLPKNKAQLLVRLRHRGYDLIVLGFLHSPMVPDVLWGQLFSLERAVAGLATRHEFRVLHSGVWSDEKRSSAILVSVENANLPTSQLHTGPPVSREEESKSFLTRHLGASDTISGPRIEGNRWMVEKKRIFPNLRTLLSAAAKPHSKLGLAVPTQLEPGFRREIRVLINEETLSLYSQPGFVKALWNFMDGKPSWLRKPRD